MSFDVTKIIDGKRLLCQCEHSNNILPYKDRNNPTLRSEKFANVENILDGLKKIDECNDLPLRITDRMGIVRQLKIGTKVFSSLSVAEKVAEFDHDLKFPLLL